ncbi:MAG: hypothetical protein KDI39_14505, partial [Pseudomonadales bacterium]|nr:hypothetical protein [Pseudomonadales bacterium]
SLIVAALHSVISGFGVVMGVGNYFCPDGCNVYIDKEEVYGENYWEEEDDFYDFSFFYDCLIDFIIESLSKTFTATDRKFLDRERVLIAESAMYQVTIVDWENYFSLNIEPIEDLKHSPLAKYHLEVVANRIFDKINACYDLSVRTSAWTSGKRMFFDGTKAA